MSDNLEASGQDKVKDQGSTPRKKKGERGSDHSDDCVDQQKTADGRKHQRANTEEKLASVTNQTGSSKGLKPKGQQKATKNSYQTGKTTTQKVSVYIKHKAELNAERRATKNMITATRYGFIEDLKICLDNGANLEYRIEENDCTALLLAAQGGHLEVTRLLLDRGCEIKAKDENGCTALLLAAQGGHLEVTRLLLDRGCNIKAKDVMGWTALMDAADRGHLEVTRLLLDRGCNRNATADFGWTALLHSVTGGHLEIIRLLLDRGCNRDATIDDGSTALHLAAIYGHLQVTRYLVTEAGISPMIDTSKGQTPYELAGLRVLNCFSNKDVTEVMEYLQTVMFQQGDGVNQESSIPIQSPLTCDQTTNMVPIEIKLMSDKKSIPLYLNLLESGSEKKRVIRLVIVGKKGSGKTSLLKRLFEEEMSNILEVPSTNGIEIHKIKCNAYSDDGVWNKLDGNNDETDLHARLLKPYEESLKRLGEENVELSVQTVAQSTPHVANTYQETPYGVNVLQGTPHTANVQKDTPNTTNTPKDTPNVAKKHKDTPNKAKTNQNKPHLATEPEPQVTPIVTNSVDIQSNPLIEQTYRDIEAMLKSEVDFHDKEEYATLLLWDFAGDEEFYHTHQTFLSPDAIYLVVTKLNEADNKEAQDLFRLWMDSIHCYCRMEDKKNISDDKATTSGDLDPPVVIVGTWKDALTSESAEMTEACKKSLLTYTENITEDERRHIRGEVFISNTEDDSSIFHQIRQNILKVARTLRTWDIDYPLKFIQLEKILQEKKKEKPIIAFDELKQITSETPMPLKDEELVLYLKFHHEIRALVYFEDLPDFIILDTQWLSDAFKCIVTAKKFRDVSIKNQKQWEEFHCRGKLHWEVLEDIFQKEHTMLYKHKNHILNVMEKFDILIHPNISARCISDRKTCYYVPCMIKAEPEHDIYEMFNVTKDSCKKSTWFCFKFSFLPSHLINHLIASLSRKYDIAEVGVPKQKKRQVALFRSTVVFELQKTKLRKLLVMTFQNIIQIQVLKFGILKRVESGLYRYVSDYVAVEINKIISTRFKMSNVKFEKKWECGLTEPEFVTGVNDFSEEEITEYYCETCTRTHKFVDEWSDVQSTGLCLSEEEQDYNPQKERTNQNKTIATKVHFRVKTDLRSLSKVSKSSTTEGLRGLTKEEKNFTKMGMIVLNILAGVLYDLLRPDKPHLPIRSECDITYLYRNLRALNKNIPSNRWGGEWQDIQNTDISIGDDIERIRLTRNELQHSKTFNLLDTRFNELINVIVDLLKRFDKHNKPSRLYTDQLNDILAKTVSMEDVKLVESETDARLEIALEVDIEQPTYVPPRRRRKSSSS